MFTFTLNIYTNRLELSARMPVTTSAAAALELSIDKWRLIVHYHESRVGRALTDQNIYLHEGGTRTCALCQCYFGAGCDSCPVDERTGQTNCAGTPFEDYVGARDEQDSNAVLLQHARAELAFLESLRESVR